MFPMLFNPFIHIAGFPAMFYGCVFMVLTAAVAAPPDDTELIEIAQKFVERFFADTDDDPFEQFQVTDAMKQYVSSDAFRQWASKIVTDYGKPGNYDKIEVVRHNQVQCSVFLFFRCERYPVKMWVTFDDNIVSGLHYDTWHEGSVAVDGRKAKAHTEGFPIAWIVYSLLLVPLLLVVTIYGDKWRSRRIESRNRDWEPFDVEQTVGTIYRESQRPFWMYLVHLLILPVFLVPIFFDGASEIAYVLVPILGLIVALYVFIAFLLDGWYVEVDEESVAVRMGGMRFRVLRIPLDSIALVDVAAFRPMRDFGGWGIKQGWTKEWRGVWGYFMSGTRGVFVRTESGKKYLLGSDTPERLAAVIRSRMEQF